MTTRRHAEKHWCAACVKGAVMELYQLKCFLAAAGRENFSRAAEDVHISQSSISKIIARLEAELGVTLFERKKGRITLNANGILFQKYAASAMQCLEEGITLVQAAAAVAQNSISIGCTASQRFDSILEEVQAIVPQCLLEAQVMSQEELLKAFEQGTLDIGFLESDKTFSSPLFEEIAKQYFVVFLTDQHEASVLQRFPPERIAEEIVCFTGREDDRRFLMHMFASEGVRPKVFAEYPDHKATAQLINTGAAIGIVPDELYFHRKQATPKLPLLALPISSDWYRRIYLLHRPLPEMNLQIQQIYDLLKEHLLEERKLIQEFFQGKGINFEQLPCKTYEKTNFNTYYGGTL